MNNEQKSANPNRLNACLRAIGFYVAGRRPKPLLKDFSIEEIEESVQFLLSKK